MSTGQDSDPAHPATAGGDRPIVVGFDGSRAAHHALRWAVPEAESRDVPLRVVSVVTGDDRHDGPAAPHGAGHSVDAAVLSVEAEAERTGKSIRVESVQIDGNVADVLIAESRHALMVCIGVPWRDRAADPLFGPTAAALATHAHCTVALIRSDSAGSPPESGVVSVVLDDEPDNDAVVHLAMQEGRLREATVRQVDRRIDSWIRRFPDVHVEIVAAGSGRAYAAGQRGPQGTQLAVVGQADADRITELEIPNCHPIVGYPDCSVLLVRR
ncbi:Universal stress protein [Mycolicibacterium vanbaalenii]|uniref:Universal stress protein n=1 Tax=Mycolicibacterium vanbaalenii TaxID=110539 RepID=A0A5S9NU35_MYCVN|nr:universal stress protein [Mycolicibacterium vanbaalenii]CAA0094152.1 Universal stress protein [Mycolicibacterium vanbaalenii]